jgi:ketosteroid isomerase-like protein
MKTVNYIYTNFTCYFMPIDADTIAAVTAALSKYAQGYSKKDVDDLMAIMDSDIFGFGSGPDEEISSLSELKNQLQRDFSQCGDLFVEFEHMRIAREGNVAWCAGGCTISAEVGNEMLRLDGRMTAVLRKAGDKWLFAHIHFSVPDQGQEAGQSFPERR